MKAKLLVMLVISSLLATGASGQDKGKTDEDKIQGTWKIASLEKGGMEVNDDFIKEARLTFTLGKIKVEAQGKEMEVSYKLDPSRKPKQIDITVNEGGKDRINQGIYSLEGDTLKICFTRDGDARPTEFTTQAGSNDQLLVLKRDKN